MPEKNGENQLITDLAESEKLEQLIYAILSMNPDVANEFTNNGKVSNKSIPLLTAFILRSGLKESLKKYPDDDPKRIGLIQDFIKDRVESINPKRKISAYKLTDAQTIIDCAISDFCNKVFPEDTESMEKMRPERTARLIRILEKLREQKIDILKGTPPDDVISRFELTRRILEVIGLNPAHKRMGVWVKRIEFIAANFVTNTTNKELGQEYNICNAQLFNIRKELIDEIINKIPELAVTLEDLCKRRKSRKGCTLAKNKTKKKHVEKPDFKEDEDAIDDFFLPGPRLLETYTTQSNPAKPLDYDEEGILRLLCPTVDPLEPDGSQQFEQAFLKEITDLKDMLGFDEQELNTIVHNIMSALLNPNSDIPDIAKTFQFLLKISRSGKSDVDSIASTIKKLLSSR